MLDASLPSLLAEQRPGTLGLLAGKGLSILYKISGRHRYDDFRLERARHAAEPGFADEAR